MGDGRCRCWNHTCCCLRWALLGSVDAGSRKGRMAVGILHACRQARDPEQPGEPLLQLQHSACRAVRLTETALSSSAPCSGLSSSQHYSGVVLGGQQVGCRLTDLWG